MQKLPVVNPQVASPVGRVADEVTRLREAAGDIASSPWAGQLTRPVRPSPLHHARRHNPGSGRRWNLGPAGLTPKNGG